MQYVWRQDDTGPVVTTQLIDGAGAPMNLVGATGLLRVFDTTPPGSVLFTRTMLLVDPAAGQVTANLLPADTAEANVGRYLAEWVITDSASNVKTYGPAPGGWIPVLIAPTGITP